MDKKKKALKDYQIFGSEFRGCEEVESRVNAIIAAKQTPENLDTLGKAFCTDWKHTDASISDLKRAFSNVEERLRERKSEILSIYASHKKTDKQDTDPNGSQDGV